MTKQLVTNDWWPLIEEECKQPYYLELQKFITQEYTQQVVHPNKDEIFHALQATPYEKVKVVILGQDPYHGPEQAHGLSFSVKPDVRIPPSLRNILKELQSDLGCEIPDNGYLGEWAEQGILLLNTVLTVREGEAHSHRGKGWEIFTNQVIRLLNEREKSVVFILWGKPAQTKISLIDKDRHQVITSVHPSPLSASRGFFGSKPFSKANELLIEMGESPIDWQISNRKGRQ